MEERRCKVNLDRGEDLARWRGSAAQRAAFIVTWHVLSYCIGKGIGSWKIIEFTAKAIEFMGKCTSWAV